MIEYIDRASGKIANELPEGHWWIKFLYKNPLGKITLHVLVKRKLLSSAIGKLMNSQWSKKDIPRFVRVNNIDTSEFLRPINKYQSFNEFFYRKLKPGCRPIGEGVTSPADGRILAFNRVKEHSDFFIKGNKFTLKKFLKSKTLAKKYENGSFVIVRLAPTDYHRFHFPAAGTPTVTTSIKGGYKSVSPIALRNSLKIICQNKRTYSTLKTEKFGDILYCEVGATMVGTILQTYTPGERVEKGDEKGYFAFGGSTVVLLFEEGKIKLSDDIINNTLNGYETFLKMGESIGE